MAPVGSSAKIEGVAAGKIRVGVGGWTFEPWRCSFYPKGLAQSKELSYMAENLTSVEINGTFYRTQTPETFQKWHDETPDDFVFAVKGPRYATNRKVLAEAGESILRFLESGVKNLRQKLGPINWQLAPTKKFDPPDVEGFLKLLPGEYAHALEVRHETFRNPEFVELARNYGVAIVFAGDSKYVSISDATAPFIYARIMGTTEENHGYSDEQLDAWATRLKQMASGESIPDLPTIGAAAEAKPRDVFAYIISGHKDVNPSMAQELIARL